MASNWRLIIHPSNRDFFRRQSIPLRIGETRIGSSEFNNIRITTKETSRFHCSIFLNRRRVLLIDYSDKGTLVNGNIILGASTRLKEGDVIQIENMNFKLVQDVTQMTVTLE